MSEPRTNDPERDATLDAAWRAHSNESPPSKLDDAILAAARREVRAKPAALEDRHAAAAARQPSRAWWGLAVAATIGAIAFSVVQLAPRDEPPLPGVASDMPADGRVAASRATEAPRTSPALDMKEERNADAGAPMTAAPPAVRREPEPAPSAPLAKPAPSPTAPAASPKPAPEASPPLASTDRAQEAAAPKVRAGASIDAPRETAPSASIAAAPPPVRAQAAPEPQRRNGFASPDAGPGADRRDTPATLGRTAPAAPALAQRDAAASGEAATPAESSTRALASAPPPPAASPPAAVMPSSGAPTPAPAPRAFPGMAEQAPLQAPERARDDAAKAGRQLADRGGHAELAVTPGASAPSGPVAKQSARGAAPAKGEPQAYVARIEDHLRAGRTSDAERELAAFRTAYPDADERLPAELRAWAAKVPRR